MFNKRSIKFKVNKTMISLDDTRLKKIFRKVHQLLSCKELIFEQKICPLFVFKKSN